MSCILHIETTTQVCSVALSQDGACLSEKTDFNGPQHAAVLAPYAEEMLSFADSHASKSYHACVVISRDETRFYALSTGVVLGDFFNVCVNAMRVALVFVPGAHFFAVIDIARFVDVVYALGRKGIIQRMQMSYLYV